MGEIYLMLGIFPNKVTPDINFINEVLVPFNVPVVKMLCR